MSTAPTQPAEKYPEQKAAEFAAAKAAAAAKLQADMRQMGEKGTSRRPGSDDGAVTRLLEAHAVLVDTLPYGRARNQLRQAGGFINGYMRHENAHLPIEIRLMRIVGAEAGLNGFLTDQSAMQTLGVKTFNDAAGKEPSQVHAALTQYREALPAVLKFMGEARHYLHTYEPQIALPAAPGVGMAR